MLRWLRSRPRHPSPVMATFALTEGACMYAGVTKCNGKLRRTGLRDRDDPAVVLVCRAHFGRLRKLGERDADELERHLTRAFAR